MLRNGLNLCIGISMFKFFKVFWAEEPDIFWFGLFNNALHYGIGVKIFDLGFDFVK